LPWHALWRGYGYPNDLLGKLKQQRARICDVVVRPVYASEVSGVRLRHALFVVPYVLLRVVLGRARAHARELAAALGLHAGPSRHSADTEPRLSLELEPDKREAQPNA
jgi:hypothetical protein